MKKLKIFILALLPIAASGQVVSPEETTTEQASTAEVLEGTVDGEAAKSDSTKINIFLGVGLLPTHKLVKQDFIKAPFRVMMGATNAYKGFGIVGTVEWRKAETPYFENDPSVVTDRYFRAIFGPSYTIGPLTLYAQMDLFGPYGFFRSVGNGNNIVGSGRKALGASFDVYKGLSLALDFSSYAGVGVNVAYVLPIGI